MLAFSTSAFASASRGRPQTTVVDRLVEQRAPSCPLPSKERRWPAAGDVSTVAPFVQHVCPVSSVHTEASKESARGLTTVQRSRNTWRSLTTWPKPARRTFNGSRSRFIWCVAPELRVGDTPVRPRSPERRRDERRVEAVDLEDAGTARGIAPGET